MFLSDDDIVTEICRFQFSEMGIGPAPDIEKLKQVSLRQMLDAAHAIERQNAEAKAVDGTRTFSVVPDDRLVAAVYTWLHYCAPGYHDVGDGDDSIVHIKIDSNIHGLIKWARPARNE